MPPEVNDHAVATTERVNDSGGPARSIVRPANWDWVNVHEPLPLFVPAENVTAGGTSKVVTDTMGFGPPGLTPTLRGRRRALERKCPRRGE